MLYQIAKNYQSSELTTSKKKNTSSSAFLLQPRVGAPWGPSCSPRVLCVVLWLFQSSTAAGAGGSHWVGAGEQSPKVLLFWLWWKGGRITQKEYGNNTGEDEESQKVLLRLCSTTWSQQTNSSVLPFIKVNKARLCFADSAVRSCLLAPAKCLILCIKELRRSSWRICSLWNFVVFWFVCFLFVVLLKITSVVSLLHSPWCFTYLFL